MGTRTLSHEGGVGRILNWRLFGFVGDGLGWLVLTGLAGSPTSASPEGPNSPIQNLQPRTPTAHHPLGCAATTPLVFVTSPTEPNHSKLSYQDFLNPTRGADYKPAADSE